MKTFDFFLRPVITEKATSAEKKGKFQFFVRPYATKVDIRAAFKEIYGVDAAKVNVIKTPKKTKIGKARTPVTKRPALKKVIITTKGLKVIDAMKPKVKS
ncbi:MAG: 50S ribosomal protein L23 [Patescibacteria group bacterium]